MKYLSILIILLFGCQSISKIKINNVDYKTDIIDGTKQINDNLFADLTEVTNSDYREYLNWTKKIFGEKSKKYLDSYPDTLVWVNEFEGYNESFVTNYFQHPAFNDYPVVGISFSQALIFTDWRTEQETKSLLIKRKLIDSSFEETQDNYFTIKRYFNGDYKWILEKKNILIPKFKIPSENEWIDIAQSNLKNEYGIDSLSKMTKNYIKKGSLLFNTKEHKKSMYNMHYSLDGVWIFPVESFPTSVQGLYNVIGNVSEMIDEPGYSKGGSWNHNLSESNIVKLQKYENPNPWTGLRNVFSWRFIQE